MQVVSDCGTVLCIQIGVDLIEDVEWCRVCCLNGEDQSKTAQTCGKHVRMVRLSGKDQSLTFLSATQLLYPLLVVMLAIETDADTDSSKVLDSFLAGL